MADQSPTEFANAVLTIQANQGTQQANPSDAACGEVMASPTQSRSIGILSPTIDAIRYQNPEKSNPHTVSNAGQLVTHYNSIPNTTSRPTQPPNADSRASQPDSTNNADSRQIKPLNPKAAIFVPAELEYFYDQHRSAYLRKKMIEIDMNDFEDMCRNDEEGGYDYERLGKLSRELAFRFMDAEDERVKWITAIEKKYGSAALGGRSRRSSEDCIQIY